MYGETSETTKLARKVSSAKYTSKIHFFGRTVYVTTADADIESLKSLHTLFDKYLCPILVETEQNSMI